MLHSTYFKVSHQGILLHLTWLILPQETLCHPLQILPVWSHPLPMSQSSPDFVTQSAYLGYQCAEILENDDLNWSQFC